MLLENQVLAWKLPWINNLGTHALCLLPALDELPLTTRYSGVRMVTCTLVYFTVLGQYPIRQYSCSGRSEAPRDSTGNTSTARDGKSTQVASHSSDIYPFST
jgi:hypothetical protein